MGKKKLRIVNLYNNKKYVPQVANWIFSEFIDGHIDNCTHSDILEALNARIENMIPMTFIGLVGSECVGTISIFTNDLKNKPELSPWLAALYVDVKYRKKGYAQELMNKIEKIAADLGFSKLYLRTETASNYYLKHGWIKLVETVDENGINTTVFEKNFIQ